MYVCHFVCLNMELKISALCALPCKGNGLWGYVHTTQMIPSLALFTVNHDQIIDPPLTLSAPDIHMQRLFHRKHAAEARGRMGTVPLIPKDAVAGGEEEGRVATVGELVAEFGIGVGVAGFVRVAFGGSFGSGGDGFCDGEQAVFLSGMKWRTG